MWLCARWADLDGTEGRPSMSTDAGILFLTHHFGAVLYPLNLSIESRLIRRGGEQLQLIAGGEADSGSRSVGFSRQKVRCKF